MYLYETPKKCSAHKQPDHADHAFFHNAYKNPVIQLTSCGELVELGNFWRTQIWMAGQTPPHAEAPSVASTSYYSYPMRQSAVDAGAAIKEEVGRMSRKQRQSRNAEERIRLQPFAEYVNNHMPEGYTISQGYQPYDPVIRLSSKAAPHTYKQLVSMLDEDSTGNARAFLEFVNGNATLESLSDALREFCVIVFVAEIGRGYSPDGVIELATDILESDAGIRWTNIAKYFPAVLSAAADGDFEPDEESSDED